MRLELDDRGLLGWRHRGVAHLLEDDAAAADRDEHGAFGDAGRLELFAKLSPMRRAVSPESCGGASPSASVHDKACSIRACPPRAVPATT